MPKGPRVHEIFSSSGQNMGASKKNETKQHGGLSGKKTLAPLPPMKKFGGYKPKILGGTEDLSSVNYEHPPHQSPPTSPAAFTPRPILTNPKPFIIGDKDTPMVLSTVGDNDDENNNIDSAMNDLNIYATVEDIDPINPSAVDKSNSEFTQESRLNGSHFNPDLQSDPYFHETDKKDLIDKDSLVPSSADFASENPAFTISPEDERLRHGDLESEQSKVELFKKEGDQSEVFEVEQQEQHEQNENRDDKMDGVHIPEPDYDEKMETMEFFEEDPDDLPEYNRNLRPKPAPSVPRPPTMASLTSRVYLGEDWGQYLSDDDDELLRANGDPNSGKRRQELIERITQKHSIFKSPAHSNNNNNNNNNNKNIYNKSSTSNRRSSKSKIQPPCNNSVRNFSYEDSKLGTKGRSKGRAMVFSGSANDHGHFQEDSYESFLFSRHGHTMPARLSSPPIARDMPQWDGAQSGNVRLWKKVTVRLKNKLNMNKNGYTMR